jgi:predicted alpha/beta-hydrolase family hydrolase
MPDAQPVTITLDSGDHVSGLWLAPSSARACLALAHGAGVGMTHQSMATLAMALAERDIATLRYQFLYMERGSKRPDAPPLAHKVVRAAVAEAAKRAGKLPLFAGGRSFGGRMTSQAQAAAPLPQVRGLVFFSFPLHPAGKPSDERAVHLSHVRIPVLFLQGTNDALARLDLLQSVVGDLGEQVTLKLVEGADHSFHVPAKSGRKDADVLAEVTGAAADWMSRFFKPSR